MADLEAEAAQVRLLDGQIFPMAGTALDDAHGRAALLLVESLLHALVDKAVITRGEAIDVIDIAADVEAALAGTIHGPGGSDQSHLAPLAHTFRVDVNE